MFPKMDDRAVKVAMKKMGMRQQEIEASEVIIRCADKNIVIENPQVSKIVMMGQEMFQISGAAFEKPLETEVSGEDVKTVMEKAGVSEEEARKALIKVNGDLAEAILDLNKV